MSDMVGKDGIEKAFEDYLKGTNGRKSLDQTGGNSSSDTIYSKEPIPGNNVVLTIDKDLQQVAETSLEKTIKSIAAGGKASGSYVGSGYDARSGAVVVLDVNSGETLAMASYPTFNLSTFNKDYKSLETNTAKPMFNRAISGAYEPGSTFKMLTALAGLEVE
jgi:penicillin-binding protein 2